MRDNASDLRELILLVTWPKNVTRASKHTVHVARRLYPPAPGNEVHASLTPCGKSISDFGIVDGYSAELTFMGEQSTGWCRECKDAWVAALHLARAKLAAHTPSSNTGVNFEGTGEKQ